jgi:glycosyltransferase involved in cell wall biosynthesis
MKIESKSAELHEASGCLPLTAAAPENAAHRSSCRRLAVVISHPIQHFAPLFRDLARQPGLELRVFYCCDWGIRDYADPGFGRTLKWDVPLLDGYESEFLPIAKRPVDLSYRAIDNPAVNARLTQFQPDAVWVHGYGHRTSWRTLKWANKNRRRVLYFGDSELLAPRGWKSRLLKRLILPKFFSRCDRFLTIGDNNECYYRHYGVPGHKMIRGSFPVDVARFRGAVAALSLADRVELRKRFGLRPEALVVLFLGKMIDIKRPLDLVRAIDQLRSHLPDAQALMLGSGPLETAVRDEVEKRDLKDHVILPGFINQTEMPRLLWLGDCLAMCSEKDPHPLAVTEAMSVGNAVIASDRVGCVGPTDAARPGENVLVYPCGDVDGLAQQIQRLATDPAMLQKFRTRSIELAATQDTLVMVRAVLSAMEISTER